MRKSNSKTNLFLKKSNTSDKSSSNENNETPISQQTDLQQRQQEVQRSNNETNYQEMGKKYQP